MVRDILGSFLAFSKNAPNHEHQELLLTLNQIHEKEKENALGLSNTN